MENNSNTTNNVNNEFTTTTTNAVEITPANLELAKLQGDLDSTIAELNQFRQSLQIQREVHNDLRCSIAESMYHLLQHLDADVIADTICRLNTTKETNIIKYMADRMPNIVKDGIKESDNADEFITEIDDLDDYISDKYSEGDIINLIDAKYSWNTLFSIAFRQNSIDDNDVMDFIDMEEAVKEELQKGNISFDDLMDNFTEDDCYEYIRSNGGISWSDVKDDVDMDDVRSDIDLDNDMVTEYASRLSDSDFRNLISNLN